MMKKYMTHEEVLQLLKDGYDKPRGWTGRYHHKHKKYKWYYLNYKHNRKYRLREGDTIAF